MEFLTGNLNSSGTIYSINVDIKDVQIIEFDTPLPFMDNIFKTNIVYDSSGYSHNGTITGTLTAAAGSSRYSVSSFFGAYRTPLLETSNTSWLTGLTNGTISWWEYCTTTGNSLPFRGQDGSHYIAAGSTTTRLYDDNAGTTSILYKDGVAETNPSIQNTTSRVHNAIFHTQNQWHHFVLVGVNLSSWTAFAINNYSSGWPVNAYLSDVRIYATALTAAQVKELYNTSMSVDSSGNIYARELSEVL